MGTRRYREVRSYEVHLVCVQCAWYVTDLPRLSKPTREALVTYVFAMFAVQH